MEDILKLANEWWLTKEVSDKKAKQYYRDVFKELTRVLEYKQIIILTGLRRVGKSTLMFQLIKELLKKVNERNILYFNFDDKTLEPLDILKGYGKLTGTDWKKEKCFIFFDEVQKIKDWSSKIKFLHDNLPNLKIFISGSASLMIESEAINNLAGRYFLREIKPLSLKEFTELYLDKKIERVELYRDEFERLFSDYVRKPFPEIVKWKDEREINEYIKELVIDKVLRIDIPENFKININLLSNLTQMFLTTPGIILNLSNLAKDLKVHKITLENHIHYLEFAKIIKIIKNFRPSIRAESRKMKKIYPFNISLSFPYYPSLDKGKLFETLVSMEMMNYWRSGFREIDFIKREKNKLVAVEVKAKEILDKEELRNIFYFIKKYKAEAGIVVYSGKSKLEKFDSVKIKFINIIDFLLGLKD